MLHFLLESCFCSQQSTCNKEKLAHLLHHFLFRVQILEDGLVLLGIHLDQVVFEVRLYSLRFDHLV